MAFSPDARDLLLVLSARGVDWMIVGAHAVGAHGFPRATGDFDVWVRASPETAPAVVAALEEWAGESGVFREADFATPLAVVQFGVVPWRIDVLTHISGVDFASAWERRLILQIDGMAVAFIGRADLERNKAQAGRPKDLVDLRRLRGEPGDDD